MNRLSRKARREAIERKHGNWMGLNPPSSAEQDEENASYSRGLYANQYSNRHGPIAERVEDGLRYGLWIDRAIQQEKQ